MPGCVKVLSPPWPSRAALSPASTTACSHSGHSGVPAYMRIAKNLRGRKVCGSKVDMKTNLAFERFAEPYVDLLQCWIIVDSAYCIGVLIMSALANKMLSYYEILSKHLLTKLRHDGC